MFAVHEIADPGHMLINDNSCEFSLQLNGLDSLAAMAAISEAVPGYPLGSSFHSGTLTNNNFLLNTPRNQNHNHQHQQQLLSQHPPSSSMYANSVSKDNFGHSGAFHSFSNFGQRQQLSVINMDAASHLAMSYVDYNNIETPLHSSYYAVRVLLEALTFVNLKAIFICMHFDEFVRCRDFAPTFRLL